MANTQAQLSFDQQQSFMRAISDAVHEQVAPALFDKEKMIDMDLPYHKASDHYRTSFMTSGEEPYKSQSAGLMTRILVKDPFVPDARITAAPKSIQVAFEGQDYDIPLVLGKSPRAARSTPKEWKTSLEDKYEARKIVHMLEKPLKDKFNLEASEDYNISYDASEPGETYYHVQFEPRQSIVDAYNAATKRGPADLRLEVQQHIEERLQILQPERKTTVAMVGQAVAF